MTKKYQISIITPTLNAEKYIKNCIISIKKQRNINIQHIIVDAGSNDETLKIIQNFDDIELYKLEGSSIYEALNYGANFVNSSFIGFLNADDEYTQDNTLSLIHKKFLKCNYDKQIIYGNCKFINNKKELLYRLFPGVKINYFFAKIRIFNISHPSWFISTKAFKLLNGYDTNLKFISDCDMIIRSLKNPLIKLNYINLDVANFLIHNKNLSRSKEAEMEMKNYNKFIFSNFLFYVFQVFLYIKDPKYFLYRIKRFINSFN